MSESFLRRPFINDVLKVRTRIHEGLGVGSDLGMSVCVFGVCVLAQMQLLLSLSLSLFIYLSLSLVHRMKK